MFTMILLACGMASAVVYIATDVVGGLRYPGYSFTAQAISELMASGAPSEAFVDPLFMLYGVLGIAFGIGVYREGAKRNRALKAAGVLLVAYAAIGLTGPTLFEMHQRGMGNANRDLPHIVLTGALVLLLVSAMGVGAFALGKRFRVYTFATLVTVIVFGVITAPYGARLAAGENTPGFGIIERITIYASVVWVAVLSVSLGRLRSYDALHGRSDRAPARHEALEGR